MELGGQLDELLVLPVAVLTCLFIQSWFYCILVFACSRHGDK